MCSDLVTIYSCYIVMFFFQNYYSILPQFTIDLSSLFFFHSVHTQRIIVILNRKGPT